MHKMDRRGLGRGSRSAWEPCSSASSSSRRPYPRPRPGDATRDGTSSPVPMRDAPSSDFLIGHRLHQHLELLGGGRIFPSLGKTRSPTPSSTDGTGRPGRPAPTCPRRHRGFPPVGCDLRRCVRTAGRSGRRQAGRPRSRPVPLAEHWNGSAGRGADPVVTRLPLLGQLHRQLGLLGRGQLPRRQQESADRYHRPLERVAVVAGPTGVLGPALRPVRLGDLLRAPRTAGPSGHRVRIRSSTASSPASSPMCRAAGLGRALERFHVGHRSDPGARRPGRGST